MDFGEFISGSLKDRPGDIRHLPDRPDCFGKNTGESYCSIYRFGPDFTQPKNYKGPCWCTGLHFDFDSADGGAAALADAGRLVERIVNDKHGFVIDDLDIYFSGNKGIHVLAVNNELRALAGGVDVPATVKRIALGCAAGLETVDPAVYDKTRVFRVANSRHPATGLYKIPLFSAELYELEISDIRHLAESQRSLRDAATIQQFIYGVQNVAR